MNETFTCFHRSVTYKGIRRQNKFSVITYDLDKGRRYNLKISMISMLFDNSYIFLIH